jgi:outer membrane protein assembly factor BamB
MRNKARMAATVAGVMLGGFGLTGAAISEATTAVSAVPASHALTRSGAQLWTARYNGPAKGFDAARSVAVSPGGRMVFVTGTSTGAAATVAYNAATGRQVWAKRYTGQGGRGASASSVAVSPGGGKVFVAGTSREAASGADYATIAYSAATGARLWLAHYSGPGERTDDAFSLAVSPDGTMVFVTGRSAGVASGWDYATVAYSTASGKRLWVMRYTGPGNGYDAASSVAVGPGGSRVIVTGTSTGATSGGDYATVAYSSATGKQLWASRYNGRGAAGDAASSVAVGHGGGTVFVTGTGSGAAATVAYSSATGKQLWVSRYAGPASTGAAAVKVVAGPSGNAVFVTGFTVTPVNDDYVTIRYNAFTGARAWAKRYNGPASRVDNATAMTLSPSGATVYVTGLSSGGSATGGDYATIAYGAVTGKQLWIRRYTGPVNSDDSPAAIAVSPGGRRVFVTGQSIGVKTRAYFPGFDYATISYSG